MSLKTLFYELAFSAVLTLYVYEHNSSKLIIFFSLLDIAVTAWKISRTFSLTLGGSFPWIRLQPSELYKKREKIDSQAVWYMNYLLFPLMAGYLWWALHSRNYAIKDWYNFLLETAVAFIAVFGFIMMTPQLYINYCLKSVEHLNWRGLIYRFINTLLDDLFAFMVTMPNLRRLMYFRDGNPDPMQTSSSSSTYTRDGSTELIPLAELLNLTPLHSPSPPRHTQPSLSSNSDDFCL